jgi:GNAT superfamily N-acetyltransferase
MASRRMLCPGAGIRGGGGRRTVTSQSVYKCCTNRYHSEIASLLPLSFMSTSLYTSSAGLGFLPVPLRDEPLLIPISEMGVPVEAAQVLHNALPQATRLMKRWLSDEAANHKDIVDGADTLTYAFEVPDKAWQGAKLRDWLTERRVTQLDESELSLRSAPLRPQVRSFADDAFSCVDAQLIVTVRPAHASTPAGYATLKLSAQFPRVYQDASGGYRVEEGFDEFHNPSAPEVNVKVVLDEVYVLPGYRGVGLGTHFAASMAARMQRAVSHFGMFALHAPLAVDVDAEMASEAGVRYVHATLNRFWHSLTDPTQPHGTWSFDANSYPPQFRKGEACLYVRHPFDC